MTSSSARFALPDDESEGGTDEGSGDESDEEAPDGLDCDEASLVCPVSATVDADGGDFGATEVESLQPIVINNADAIAAVVHRSFTMIVPVFENRQAAMPRPEQRIGNEGFNL